jgi:hypothetical protein
MSVIGRLDEQVDAVLIAPLARKGEGQARTSAAEPHENIEQPRTATRTESEKEDSDNRRARHDELPVWLL